MTTYSLGFDIWAKDRASKTFDRLGGSVGDVDQKFGRLKTAVVTGAAAAGTALAAFAVGGIDNAADIEMALQRIDIVFGDNADTIKTWAESAATNIGMSKQEALDAAGGFGNMFQQLGFASDAAAGMSTDIVTLVADLAAFNGLPTEQVLEGMQAAFRGEYDALQRVIPSINAARIETEALSMTGKDSASALTEQEKAAAVLAIVQKDGAMASGYFADNQDKLAVSSKQAQAGMADLQAEVGAKLVPAMEGMLVTANKVLTWMQESPGQAKALAAGLGILAVTIGVVSAATKIATAVQWLHNAAWLAFPGTWIVVALVGVGAALAILWIKSEKFRDVVRGAFSAVKDAALSIYHNGLLPLKNWAVDVFLAIANAGITMYNKGIAPMMRWCLDAFATIARKFGDMLAALSKVPGFGWAQDAANKMYGAADSAESLKNKINSIPRLTRIEVAVRTVYSTYGSPTAYTPKLGYDNAVAEGGPVRRGELTLVGEEGPELMVPDRDGWVFDATDTARMLARGGPRAIAAGAGDVYVVRQAIADLGRQLHDDLDRLAVRTADMIGTRWDRTQQKFVRDLADEARRG